MGFKALGLDTCPAANAQEAKEALRRLTRDSEDYAIIYIEEGLAQQLSAEIDKFKDCPTPAIILIPGREGDTSRLRGDLRSRGRAAAVREPSAGEQRRYGRAHPAGVP